MKRRVNDMSSPSRRGASMRIIAGKWGSRRLAAPDTRRTRPMPDRIREAIFAILASRYELPGAMPPFPVADLFAGSGGMGLEAVSRGASGCDFIERGREASATLRKNLKSLDAGPACRVVMADAWTAPLTTPRPPQPFGLLIVDPPYSDARDSGPHGRVATLLSDLYRASWADGESTIVLHHEADIEYAADERARWTVYDRRVYGRAAITFIETRPPATKVDEVVTNGSNT